LIVHVGFLSLIVNRKGGLAVITSRVDRDAQGKAGNIVRLSDDHSIIAIWQSHRPVHPISARLQSFSAVL
jgi:hypothetical protein